MIESLLYKFAETWMLGLFAMLLGRFIGRTSVRFPETWRARFTVFMKVWGVTFLAVLTFGYAGYILRLQEHTQSGFAEFLLPLVVGAYFCRQTLKEKSHVKSHHE